ncbi:MAG: flagellar biosynthesis protein FlhB [Bdellovibrionaceae bacterium]|nr:flagellar biosynthesis protein FlhB [Pseudobdellovibrionaceae bacterium]
MAVDSEQERTEEATQQRRDDFRRRGQVAQTREVGIVISLLGFALFFYLMSGFFAQQITESYELVYGYISSGQFGPEHIQPLLMSLTIRGMLILLPVFFMSVIITIGSSLLQVGFMYNEEALTPDFEKINPIQGFKRLFSLKSVVEGIKAILKMAIIGFTAYYVIKATLNVLPQMLTLAPHEILTFLVENIFRLILGVGGVLIVIAAADYFFQRYQMEEQMKMTKQEIRDEAKTREGDPLIKARIRRVQKEVAQRRMMADVPKADVIITNPTHLAIALKYSPEKYAAPIMIAKGQDHVALRMREIAKEHNIPIVENKPLARAMYKTMEIGHVIPRDLFAAVAEVLAYVFKLKRRRIV